MGRVRELCLGSTNYLKVHTFLGCWFPLLPHALALSKSDGKTLMARVRGLRQQEHHQRSVVQSIIPVTRMASQTTIQTMIPRNLSPEEGDDDPDKHQSREDNQK